MHLNLNVVNVFSKNINNFKHKKQKLDIPYLTYN